MTATATTNSAPVSMFVLEGQYSRLVDMVELGHDPETGEYLEPGELLEAWDAITDDAADKAVSTGHVVRKLQAKAAMVKAEADRLAARAKSYENAAGRLKGRLRDFMQTVHMDKAQSPGLTVTIGAPSKLVEIRNAKQVPKAYRLPPAPPKPDKRAIASALKAGKSVRGCRLIDGERRVMIR